MKCFYNAKVVTSCKKRIAVLLRTLTLVKRKRTRSVANEANLADWKSMNLTSVGRISFWSLLLYLNRILDSHRSP